MERKFETNMHGRQLLELHPRNTETGFVSSTSLPATFDPSTHNSPSIVNTTMGRLAEMQRKLLEVKKHARWYLAGTENVVQQQMMGPEAMGVANANLVWSDDKVCRNFLCGTCPHALFTNTVSSLQPHNARTC